jgi:hypothetical protein
MKERRDRTPYQRTVQKLPVGVYKMKGAWRHCCRVRAVNVKSNQAAE